MPSDPTFRDTLPETCDFLVVGAGPAGLVAAYTLVSRKAGSVVLIDRRDPWREPVACGEGVRLEPLRKASPLPVDSWIRNPIHRCLFATPQASFVWQSPGDGATLDRALMHRDLSLNVAEQGALCHFRCRAVDLSRQMDGIRTLRFDGETSGTIRARSVIDASGPGAGLGRDEGLARGDIDLEPAVFSLVEGLEFDPEAIQLWYSKNFAPGGYAWLFPSSPGRANVGVVCARGSGLAPREGLRRFLSHLKPGLEPQAVHGGVIPCGSGNGILAKEMLFKVGDAASMVHPLGRSGIVEAMEAGRMAAESAMAALAEPNENHREIHYLRYSKSWQTSRGRAYAWAGRLKPLLGKLDDQVWSALFGDLSKIPIGQHRWRHAVLSGLKVLPRMAWSLLSAR